MQCCAIVYYTVSALTDQQPQASSRPRLTRGGSFIESDSDMDDSHSPPPKPHPSKRDVGTDKPLKRVRQLDDDSDNEESDTGSPEVKEGKGQERSLSSQPSTKRIRKWVDSDSESESSDSGDDAMMTSPSPTRSKEEKVGGARVATATVREDSDSEDEGQLMIDLREVTQDENREREDKMAVEEDIHSPVQETVDLVHIEGGGEEMEREGECGSMATLELAETVHHDLDLSEE